MSDCIKVSISDGIADVRLNREDKMNAINNDMFDTMIEVAAQLDADKSVRVAVVSGEGRAFCAGLDMSNFAAMLDPSAGETLEPLSKRTHGITNRVQQASFAWRNMRVPVIAAVHGVALGGGFQIMLGSDIRYVHPETRLSILEVKWGLVPDLGGTAIMHSLAGDDIIRELTYTGRMFSGTEAKEYGFATHLSQDPIADALTLAAEIASKSPSAVQASKELYNTVAHGDAAEILQKESSLQDGIIGKPNQLEAVMAGLEKRVANFSD